MMISRETSLRFVEVIVILLLAWTTLASCRHHRDRQSNQQKLRHHRHQHLNHQQQQQQQPQPQQQKQQQQKQQQQKQQQQNQQKQQEEVCVEPESLKEQLEGLYGNPSPGQVHDSFLLLPSMREALEISSTLTGLSDNSSCTQVFSGPAKGQSPGDPCPTYTCLNTDRNRQPRVLLETRCSKGRCRGQPEVWKGNSRMIPSCEGVFHPVKVLRRTGCREGFYQYVSTWHQLQVGCACRWVGVA